LNSTKKIFITRDLSSNSFFKTELEKKGFHVHGESLLEFELIPFEEIPEADWIFFYSQKGVDFFFQNIKTQNIFLDKKINIAGFGEKTAERIVLHGIKCNFIGTGKAATTTPFFLEKTKGLKVLFPRAENSQRSVQQIIGDQIITEDLVLYKNFAKKDFHISKMDALVFTSPLNAKAYFKKYKFEEGQLVFAIGETTAQTLLNLGIQKVFFPKKPAEEELVNILLEKI